MSSALPKRSPKIGLFGGSFNPIHHGHLVMAARAAEEMGLDRVLFVPAAVSPLKEPAALAPDRHRWAMLKLALRGHPLFEPCNIELRRGGVSYTIDTVRALQEGARARIFLILGSDAFELLPHWKALDELRRLVTFVQVARKDHRPRLRMPKEYIVRMPLLEISGTEIRRRVKRGLSIRYLVPDPVERYIRQKGLYR